MALVLAWGKCTVYVKKNVTSSTTFNKEPEIVENSTNLEPTQGKTLEAPVEGGALQAFKQLENRYLLKYQLRVASGVKSNIEHSNGVVADNYSVAIVPENEAAYGVLIENASVSVLDNQFNSEAGIVDEFQFTPLLPDDGSKIVKRGKLAVTGSAEQGFTITGSEGDFE